MHNTVIKKPLRKKKCSLIQINDDESMNASCFVLCFSFTLDFYDTISVCDNELADFPHTFGEIAIVTPIHITFYVLKKSSRLHMELLHFMLHLSRG